MVSWDMLEVSAPGVETQFYIDGKRASGRTYRAISDHATRKDCFSTTTKGEKVYHRFCAYRDDI